MSTTTTSMNVALTSSCPRRSSAGGDLCPCQRAQRNYTFENAKPDGLKRSPVGFCTNFFTRPQPGHVLCQIFCQIGSLRSLTRHRALGHPLTTFCKNFQVWGCRTAREVHTRVSVCRRAHSQPLFARFREAKISRKVKNHPVWSLGDVRTLWHGIS